MTSDFTLHWVVGTIGVDEDPDFCSFTSLHIIYIYWIGVCGPTKPHDQFEGLQEAACGMHSMVALSVVNCSEIDAVGDVDIRWT